MLRVAPENDEERWGLIKSNKGVRERALSLQKIAALLTGF